MYVCMCGYRCVCVCLLRKYELTCHFLNGYQCFIYIIDCTSRQINRAHVVCDADQRIRRQQRSTNDVTAKCNHRVSQLVVQQLPVWWWRHWLHATNNYVANCNSQFTTIQLGVVTSLALFRVSWFNCYNTVLIKHILMTSPTQFNKSLIKPCLWWELADAYTH